MALHTQVLYGLSLLWSRLLGEEEHIKRRDRNADNVETANTQMRLETRSGPNLCAPILSSPLTTRFSECR